MKNTGYRRMADDIGEVTPKGAQVELKVYAYPDGHGNIIEVGGTNHPVADDLEAVDALLSMWIGLRRTAAHREPAAVS